MTRKGILLSVLAVLTAAVLVAGCGDSNVETVDRGETESTPKQMQMPNDDIHAGLAGATSAAAGITWTIPDQWTTGPQRQMAADLGYHFAAPYGDMMLTGSFGLVTATRRLLGDLPSER